VRRMRREVGANQAIFDLPVRKWFVPDNRLDLGAVHGGRRAATPVGPAAGPHTQLAQNIVLAWLAGGRIVELKTVQVNDRLTIPRPCIHVPNVGLNVEWSQELLVEESAREYAKAAFLIEILKATGVFGVMEDVDPVQFDTVFDISVGYDLEGIRSAKITGFLDTLRDPGPLYEDLRRELVGDLAEYRELQPRTPLADSVTLSTFHGCPAEQIEAIGRYLLEHRGLHTIIKLNPTLLGFDRVRHLLHEELGYHQFALERDAFEQDLRYDACLEILRRLRDVADACGKTLGAKFTNTLVVRNEPDVFPTQTDPYMYLSGPPLHVISMTLMQHLREDLGFEFPGSFSAGIDAKNFANAVACGMVPVTTCTDLLRQGGFGRLPPYVRSLARDMERLGVTSREAYVLAFGGHGVDAVQAALAFADGGTAIWEREQDRLDVCARERPDELPDVLRALGRAGGFDPDALVRRATWQAGRLNGRAIVAALRDQPRYRASANAKAPRRIESTLALYDCINCDLCIAACPNDAIFAYDVEPVDVVTELARAEGERVVWERGGGFVVREAHQLAVFEGACNECSNCEVYCPEHGAPFEVKERVFGTLGDFERCHWLDGFCRDGGVLHARLDGRTVRLALPKDGSQATIRGDGLEMHCTWPAIAVVKGGLTVPDTGFDTALLWRMRTVWQGIFNASRPNSVNAAGES
jgi:putative selenate reductase